VNASASMGATQSTPPSLSDGPIELPLDVAETCDSSIGKYYDEGDGADAGFATAAAAAAASHHPDAAMLPPPPALVMEYRLDGRVLGTGAFGTVRLAASIRTGHQVAVKIVKRRKLDERAELLLQREVSHHEKLRHQNIVRLHAWVRTPRQYYLVMEYCKLGDCLDYLNKAGELSDAEVRGLFHQLLEGLAFCHSLGCYHRDLKLENLLLCPAEHAVELATASHAALPQLKIADFGLSAIVPVADMCGTLCGSPLYAAPELLGRYHGQYDPSRSDMWSCGVILYALLTSAMPFDSDDIRDLIAQIQSGVPRSAVPMSRGADAKKLVCSLLSVDPAGRPAAADLLTGSEWLMQQPLVNRQSSDSTANMSVSALAANCDEAQPARRGVTESSEFFKQMLRRQREQEANALRIQPGLMDAHEVLEVPEVAREPGRLLTKQELEEIKAEIVQTTTT